VKGGEKGRRGGAERPEAYGASARPAPFPPPHLPMYYVSARNTRIASHMHPSTSFLSSAHAATERLGRRFRTCFGIDRLVGRRPGADSAQGTSHRSQTYNRMDVPGWFPFVVIASRPPLTNHLWMLPPMTAANLALVPRVKASHHGRLLPFPQLRQKAELLAVQADFHDRKSTA
jgi:hypothetical protein